MCWYCTVSNFRSVAIWSVEIDVVLQLQKIHSLPPQQRCSTMNQNVERFWDVAETCPVGVMSLIEMADLLLWLHSSRQVLLTHKVEFGGKKSPARSYRQKVLYTPDNVWYYFILTLAHHFAWFVLCSVTSCSKGCFPLYLQTSCRCLRCFSRWLKGAKVTWDGLWSSTVVTIQIHTSISSYLYICLSFCLYIHVNNAWFRRGSTMTKRTSSLICWHCHAADFGTLHNTVTRLCASSSSQT